MRPAALPIAAVLLFAAGVAPSVADVTGYEVVSATSPALSNASKSLLVECPEGKFALGGGTSTFGAGVPASHTPATIWMNAPTGFPVATGWNGAAHCDCPAAANWGLRVDVICGEAPGLERVSSFTPLSSNDTRFTQAICSVGNAALSGGAQTSGAVSSTALLESVESTAAAYGFDSGWAASARGPASSTWSLQSVAICADAAATAPVSNYTSTATSTGPDLLQVSACPDGLVAIGGAARAVPINNATGADDARLTAIAPDGPIDAPTGWTATARRPASNTAEWRLTVGVVCVPEADASLLAVGAGLALGAMARRRGRRANARGAAPGQRPGV